MKRQVAKIQSKGTFTVINDSGARFNPYTVYWTYHDWDNGQMKTHKMKMVSYADLNSALYYIADVIRMGK